MERNGFDNGPSSAWVSRFLENNDDLSKRFGKNISINRLKSMNRQNLNDFYSLLTPLFTDNIPGDVIFNCDEAGFCQTPKEGCLLAPRGTKCLFQTVPSDGHTYTTVHICGNAKGHIISPLIVFKGVKFNKELKNVAHDEYGAKYNPSDSGWMKREIFIDWLENVFFLEATLLRPQSYTGPLFLLFDGHSTHTSIEVVEVATRLNIVLIKLPSHSTHLLQPLDVSFFGPLKTHWFNIINEWNRKYNKPVPNNHFPSLLKRTFEQIKSTWLVNGFKATGIFPVNPKAIPDSKLNAAQPWNNNGWRWFDEFESVVDKLKKIDPTQTSVMETVCLEHIISVLEPQPIPVIPQTTTFTYVPSQEDRLKRGSGFGAVLTEPSTSYSTATSTFSFEKLNLASQNTINASTKHHQYLLTPHPPKHHQQHQFHLIIKNNV